MRTRPFPVCLPLALCMLVFTPVGRAQVAATLDEISRSSGCRPCQ